MTTATLRNPPKPSQSQQRNFGVRPDLTLTAWAEQHVRVTEGPLVEGGASIPWSSQTFPLQRTVMDSIESSDWSRTVLVTAPQAFGKTLCSAVAVLLHALAYLRVSAFYVAASAHLSVTQWRKKLEPALKADSELAKLIFENPDFGGTQERHDFTNGTSLHMAGCQSVGSLSAFTASVVVCDDVQAYPGSLPRFGHPADYASSRSEAFPAESCRHVFIGTAGAPEDWLWRSLRASAFFCPFVPCLACGTYQLIEFDRFEFDAEDPDAARDDTWMRCAGDECDHHIVFDELPEMLERHLWVSMPPDADWIDKPTEGGVTVDPDEASVYPATERNTNVAGFCCNAFYWPFGRTWGQRAADHVSMKGDDEKLRTWQQNILVRPWSPPEVDEEALTVQELESHVAETGYAAKTVPEEADVVTVTVDVQSGYVYYDVRAWRLADGASWLIDIGTVGRPIHGFETEAERVQRRTLGITRGLDAVDSMCVQGWPHGAGRITATLGLIDRGYETDVVAGWCLWRHRGVWHTVKGAPADQKATLWSQKPAVDGRNRPYRRLDVNQAKHTLRRLLRIPAGQPGYWHMPTTGLHRNTVRAYFRHMVSERFNRDLAVPRWENRDSRTKKKANHFWDCETMGICAAVAVGVQFPGSPVVVSSGKPWFRNVPKNRRRR